MFSSLVYGQSCKCDVDPCGPCEKAVGHTFYTAPCDGGRQVKSCKRYTCEPVENAKVCLAQLKGISAKVASSKVRATKKVLKRTVGVTLVLKGQVRLVRRSGAVPFRRGTKLYEGDLIETGAKGKVMVKLLKNSEALSVRGPAATSRGKNLLTVNNNSKVTIVRHNFSEDEKQTLLKLWYGKIRSKVGDNYKNSNSGKASYQIHAGAAVAGVRGTEFVTEFRKGQDKWETTIKTLKGKVELSGLNQDQKVEIEEGQKASFVVDRPIRKSGFTPAELEEMAQRGILTPVYKMKVKEIQQIDWDTSFVGAKDRSVASKEQNSVEVSPNICQKPMGKFQQCAWTCKGNTPGSSTCRTDMPGVKCIRKVCDANGDWSVPTEFMSHSEGVCPASGTFVGKCNP